MLLFTFVKKNGDIYNKYFKAIINNETYLFARFLR